MSYYGDWFAMQGEVDSPSVKKRKLHLQGFMLCHNSLYCKYYIRIHWDSNEQFRTKEKMEVVIIKIISYHYQFRCVEGTVSAIVTLLVLLLLQKIIPDSVTKEVTGDTVDDVFPDSSTASSHDSTAKPEEETKPVTMTTGVSSDSMLHEMDVKHQYLPNQI